MSTAYPVFPFTEAELDYWPRPAIGVACDADEVRRADPSLRSRTAGANRRAATPPRLCACFRAMWPN